MDDKPMSDEEYQLYCEHMENEMDRAIEDEIIERKTKVKAMNKIQITEKELDEKMIKMFGRYPTEWFK